ncbi:MAG: transketolase [Planctomycetes bacterium]|nr:transketolase [Planctomycetota bacterium]
MRRAFVDALMQMAERDPRVVFLTGDLGYGVFDAYIARFGPRYVNVGVAEAQLVSAAAGLALEGFRPLAYSIASFMTGRPLEQIRFCVGYPRLPVILVGAGGGYCYSTSGVSHHAPDDVALMSLVPGMTVVVPGDPNEMRGLLPQLLKVDGPSYVRIGKFGEPAYESADPIVLGRARRLRDGEGLAVLSAGEMAPAVLDAADRLAAENVRPLVYQFHTIKPVDAEALDALARQVRTLVVVEEASPLGGLYAAVLAWRNEKGRDVDVIRLGPPDAFALGNLRRETLRQEYRFGPEAVADVCREAARRGGLRQR